MTPTSHARLAPSAAYRWSRCPGSVALINALPEAERGVQEENEYTAFGTACHGLAEAQLLGVFGATELPTPEEAAIIHPYVEYVRSREEEGAGLVVESRVSLSGLGPPEPIYGTPDAQLWSPDTLEIVDLKSGYVPVEPEENEQLTLYAAGALLGSPLEIAQWPTLVRLTIVQPRAGGIKSWEVGTDEVMRLARRIVASAWEVKPGAPLVPGDHCRFCPAQAHCPALRSHAALVAQVDFAVVPSDAPPAPDTLPIATAADILGRVDVLEAWFAALRARITRALEAGQEVPGWKLVTKRPRRVWNNAQEVEEWAEASGLGWEETHEPATIRSPAQLEEVIGKKNLPEGLYSSVSSGLTLVRSSDRRPAAALGPRAEFGALPPGSQDITAENG
jgi:hypothetical protein